MKRRQVFELTDLAWWPDLLRSLLTDYLGSAEALVRPYDAKLGLLVDALRATGSHQVVDLCSGAGGPWLRLRDPIAAQVGPELHVLLTDRYPSPSARDRVGQGGPLRYHPDPVDATAVPPELSGMRTLFDSFHHFPPEAARRILRDAVERREGIAIYESLRRSPLLFALALLTFTWVWLLTPFVRPFRWSRLLLTYVVPIAPFAIAWDGAMSILRCYTPDELLALARSVEGPRYHWVAGTYWARIVPVTYLVGWPIDTDM